ncbi:BREX system P-loop protein BrxC [Flammeovirgaceae bacterium SG7u.111]|nr:BREX system P-loop protein BrxC [Flammeovirgaceae bacterium SG7u.132]WPO34625.1 BREX system P-loop protein BrxC [Flammeovirgaceae bacterium SG7u.111]
MKIKDIFSKDINRTIETVIKADDRSHIADEVTEYVVTHEIAKKIRDFFQEYKDYSGANGVWISGFFGSGKSHLLKILSYVLENKECNGYKSGELFAEKIEDDEMLKGDVLHATTLPSESILFNIDQQAQITSKSQENAILSVFYKVFFDHLGYYGFQTHVAEFEMWLDKQGKYEAFIQQFDQKHPQEWKKARLDYFDPLVTDDIAEVLGELFGNDPSKYENILDDIEEKQKQSIEDFCERVHEYISSKPKGFRLNFFVDEVGQYISDNTKLMLNLQTIAETLATRTNGHSWILVTSQEDMEKVVGDMNKKQQNDFSRIQARFKLKIPLTSANVDEVIEKRILEKNGDAKELLANKWEEEHANLETLLSFSDGGVQFKHYKDKNDFTNKYPFVAYQFELFQHCRRALSTHNAFQGKHSAIGERSMLGVFQQVSQQIEGKEDNALVSFDLMFEGIRNELRGEIQSSITLAENNIDDLFVISVLKALFLVKYFSNFKPTKRNVSVLMLSDIHVDLKAHERKVEEALNLLENQSYIQRNGELFEFLTDDEKDVEQEIKATDIDDQSVNTLLKEIFFDEIIRDNKIKFIDNKQDYDFTSKIDGISLGREKELEIEIITPNYPSYESADILKAQTMGSNGMKMVLASDAIFLKDLKMYLRTDKYIKQNQSTANRAELKRILQEKAQQNAQRRRSLVRLGNELLAASDVYLNGSKLEMNAAGEGKNKVANAFQFLVKVAYPNLRMLANRPFSEATIQQEMNSSDDSLFAADDKTMTEAEQEILTLIQRRKSQSDRTSLNDLRDSLTRKPYGWYPNAIWTLVVRLYKRGKLELRQNTNLLDNGAVVATLLNTKQHPNTLLELQATIDPKLVRELKETYSEAFDQNCPYSEGKDIANAFKEEVGKMEGQVRELLQRKGDYPFLAMLEEHHAFLDKLGKKEYAYYLQEVRQFSDELLDFKEDVYSPLMRFWNGEQRKIYDDIRHVLNGDTSNLDYVEGDELQRLTEAFQHPKPFAGNTIKEAKAVKEQLRKKVLEKIENEKKNALAEANKALGELRERPDFTGLELHQQAQIAQPLEEEIRKISEQKYIGNIQVAKSKIKEMLLPRQLNEMARLNAENQPTAANEPTVKYNRISRVQVKYDKKEIHTEQEVEEYIAAYKEALLNEIKNNHRIVL